MKLGFVTPWYGPGIPGGAEAEVRRTAEHLHEAGLEVEVLTTCVRDFYADWGHNYHSPGSEVVSGVLVRRFPVGPRDKASFDAINAKLLQGLPISADEERAFIGEMVQAEALYEYIERHSQDYLFFFIPYMFSTTCFGVQICPERSYLIPCLHDEAYARLNVYRSAFAGLRGWLFHSAPEMALAQRLYELEPANLRLVGEGVDTAFALDADDFRRKYTPGGPFLLYAGRRDVGKNIGLLADYFGRYRRERPKHSSLRLVLIGPGKMPVRVESVGNVVDLGFVPVQDKYNAYAAAVALCQPSLRESFSIVLMESWVAGRPALVHADCAVTKYHCKRSNGGLYFANYDEFALCLDLLLDHPRLAARMGKNGQAYVLENFRWDIIVDKYRRLLEGAS
jgi:glycosyltransferase involved in cell wall biosynthesis